MPTGKQGSELPILEPVKSGTAQPTAGPVNARHTVESAAADTDPPGYSPAQIQQYLGLTGDGKGQTIAIVDAYDDPDITADAETFSQQYGLPGVCGAGGVSGDCFHLNVEEQSATAGSNGELGAGGVDGRGVGALGRARTPPSTWRRPPAATSPRCSRASPPPPPSTRRRSP